MWLMAKCRGQEGKVLEIVESYGTMRTSKNAGVRYYSVKLQIDNNTEIFFSNVRPDEIEVEFAKIVFE